MRTHVIYILLALAVALPLQAQRIESGYIAPSNLKDNHGDKQGEGAVQYISGSFSMPLAIKRGQQIKRRYSSTTAQGGQVIVKEKSDTVMTTRMWQLTLTGKYATFNYNGTTLQYLPDNTINAGAMITHVCPIAHRWNLIATAGITLNALPSYIRLQSLAITAGLIFQYTVNRNFIVGIGAVGTTAYGQPLIIPAPIINWKRGGRYSIELNMHGKPQLTIATQINKKTRLTLTPFDSERFSAVTNINGDNKIFSQNILNASLGVAYRFTKHWSLNGEAGYIYHHTVRVQERSFKAFWKDLFSDDNRIKYSNGVTFSVGLRYHFR